ncbi:hypothetical protein [uncultured Cohaesibacter sp.]|uniref:hypothetical protein n=1 Tax=uncultured Cohaesibacter sp. TaxID=1002546 RepID=UPI0029C78B0D|nr:hypothetical protein [uncultured Cohaesibacter sp.]
MTAITPKTELKAVNLILRNMGEAPVNSLSGELPLEASQAHDTLIEVSEDVQSRGWYFNREYLRLSPDRDGFIRLPPNTLSVSSVAESRGTPVENRGGRLYNMTPFEQTFKFTSQMALKITFGLDYAYLPASARRYIALRAARVFQIREEGDRMTAQEDESEESVAKAELMAEQLRKEPLSLNSSVSVARISMSGGEHPLLLNY